MSQSSLLRTRSSHPVVVADRLTVQLNRLKKKEAALAHGGDGDNLLDGIRRQLGIIYHLVATLGGSVSGEAGDLVIVITETNTDRIHDALAHANSAVASIRTAVAPGANGRMFQRALKSPRPSHVPLVALFARPDDLDDIDLAAEAAFDKLDEEYEDEMRRQYPEAFEAD